MLLKDRINTYECGISYINTLSNGGSATIN